MSMKIKTLFLTALLFTILPSAFAQGTAVRRDEATNLVSTIDNHIRRITKNGGAVVYPPAAETALSRALAFGLAVSNAVSGEKVVMPPGTYSFDRTLYIPAGVSLGLQNCYITNAIRRPTSGSGMTSTNTTMFNVRDDVSIVGEPKAWFIGEATMNAAQNTGTIGIHWEDGPTYTSLRVLIKNVWSTNLQDFIYQRSTNRSSFYLENVHAWATKDPLFVSEGTNYISAKSCSFIGTGPNPIESPNGIYVTKGARLLSGTNEFEACTLGAEVPTDVPNGLATGPTNCVALQMGGLGTTVRLTGCRLFTRSTNNAPMTYDIENGNSVVFIPDAGFVEVVGCNLNRSKTFGPITYLDPPGGGGGGTNTFFLPGDLNKFVRLGTNGAIFGTGDNGVTGWYAHYDYTNVDGDIGAGFAIDVKNNFGALWISHTNGVIKTAGNNILTWGVGLQTILENDDASIRIGLGGDDGFNFIGMPADGGGANSILLFNNSTQSASYGDGRNVLIPKAGALNLTEQIDSISTTTFFTAATILYRVSGAVTVVTGASSGTLALTIGGTTDGGPWSQSTSPVPITANGTVIPFNFLCPMGSGQNLTYATAFSGTAGPLSYTFQATAEQLQ